MPMKIPTDDTLILFGDDHTGRDEMNLAGNPFALLQAASKNGQTYIENEWERRLPNGKLVKASWKVDGDSKLGLPGPNEELLYLILLQITRESADDKGVWPQVVHFSRGDIIKRLKWTVSAANYNRLHDAFSRLQSVSIQADNAFWDARTKAPFPRIGFGLIDNFEISTEPSGTKIKGTLPLSTFRWNDKLYASFQAGNVRSLPLDFAISLKHPTSIRLFRFLDMMKGATTPPRRDFAIGVFKLSERLGMTRYKYTSKVKEKLKPATEELIQRGYLHSVSYEKSKDGTELAFFQFTSLKSIIQGRVEQSSAQQKPIKSDTATGKRTVTVKPLLPDPHDGKTSDVRADAIRCHAVFIGLDATEQSELLELAKKEVTPIWHDRVGQPDSPMSLGLWQLVAQRYPERLK
jgi:hypothetical protein